MESSAVVASSSNSLASSLAGIVLGGLAGALAGFGLVAALGLTGLAAALVAVPVGMVVATAVFAGWVTLLGTTRK